MIMKYNTAFIPEGEEGLHYELRLIGNQTDESGKPKVKSTYFRSLEELQVRMEELSLEDWQDIAFNAYYTINPVKAEVAKTSHNPDIAERRDLLLDLDPIRPANTMATEEQRQAAYAQAKEAIEWLSTEGIEDIVVADSGNGAHLHLSIAMDNTEESRRVVEDFLKQAAEKLDTATSHVDQGVHNAARLCRLYGSENCKGSDPALWRRSRIKEPKTWRREVAEKNTDIIRRLVKEWREQTVQCQQTSTPETPSEEQKSITQNTSSLMLATGLLSTAGVAYRQELLADGTIMLRLEHCPWESEHTGASRPYEASVIIDKEGRLGYKCFHAHCALRGWKELRAELKRMIHAKTTAVSAEPWQWGTSNSHWISPLDQLHTLTDNPLEGLIETGFSTLDSRLRGFLPGQLTLLCGDTSCGKTTLALSLTINLLAAGRKVAYVSNEMSPKLLLERTMQAAATADELEMGRYDWQVKETSKEAICQRLQGMVQHTGGPSATAILASLTQMRGVDLIVIDNLMSTDLASDGNSIYEQQKAFVQTLSRLAQSLDCHVLLIAHSKKTGKELPRIGDIFGSSNIANLCDNIVMQHRSSPDFEQKMRAFYKSSLPVNFDSDTYLEVMKNRTFGELGWCSLNYDVKGKRVVGGC